ncbi:ABATE domain-containing protein [Streptomonospora wellingtoniae]|uniref:ABATE domain-containing protein n=1 Tax=Streptomonospora wellingtoniae TaxID=3075544 RepID=A0ABU2KX53_9ACTN|nr:ABATE domain-containing protein [Streptomonospora sp. DSM 45055]MDT0303891.1 ABATE domain-containing protein [Streptomonospora sp. DSM 45055]
MTTPTEQTSAASLIQAFVGTGDGLADRADLAAFLRKHRLVAEGAIPITLADFEEAVSLRDAITALLRRAGGSAFDEEALVRGQRILDGLRVTVRLEPPEDPLQLLAPAVVDEVRRGLARIAAAWATLLATGEWRTIRV